MMRIFILGCLVCTATFLDIVTTQVTKGTVNRTYFSGYDVTDFGTYFSNIIRFYGDTYIYYNFGRFGNQHTEMLQPVANETFTFQFITQEENGLIWFYNRHDLKMYLAIQNGYLCFIREGSRKVQSIKLWSKTIQKVDDWHIFRMDKFGRKLNFYIDEQYIRSFTTINEIQLMGKGSVYFGGIPANLKDSAVIQRFNGGISKILYVKQLDGSLVRVSLMQDISQTHQKGIDIITPRTDNWVPTMSTTTEAIPLNTITTNLLKSISFLKRYKLQIQGYLDFRSGGTISLQFRTLQQKGFLILMTGTDPSNPCFLALEIFDGNLYLIVELGAQNRRLLISERVNNGLLQTLKLDFMSKKLNIFLNRIPTTMGLTHEELRKAYFNGGIYIGGFPRNFKSWYIWSSEYDGFIGCISELNLQNINTDMRGPVRISPSTDISTNCVAMYRYCDSNPCRHGTCTNGVDRYYCDCSSTEYTGLQCKDLALVGGFHRNQYLTYYYSARQTSRNNDVSLRFKSFQPNAFLFQTVSIISRDYIRGELENGRIKVTMKVKGQAAQEFYVGSNLNRNTWHNFYIKRRANYLELTIDKEQTAKYTIKGDNFYLRFDKIYLGSVGDSGVSLTDVKPSYIGLMQSIYWDKIDLFSKLKQLPSSAAKIIWMGNESEMNRFIYRPVAYTTYEAYSELPPLQNNIGLKTMFNFRTKDDSGIIMYSKGTGSKFIATELVGGYVNFHFNNGKTTRSIIVRTPSMIGDNKWHMFKLEEINKGGAWYFRVTVDKTVQDIRIPVDQRFQLTGSLYIGGLPMNMLKSASSVIKSSHGIIGSVASIDVNGQSPDLSSSASDKDAVLSSSKDIDMCKADSCSNNGTCIPGIPKFRCNCDMTGYTGDTCSELSVVGGFQGNQYITYHYTTKQMSEKNDISLRFKSFQPNAFLFQTVSSISDDYLRCELENGRIKVTIKVKGQREQVLFYVGSTLNSMNWNYLYIKRRGKYLELSINKETPMKYVIQGEDFNLRFDKIYVGGVGDSGVSLADVKPSYIGLMQNVNWDKADIFSKLKQLPSSAARIIWMGNESEINRFIYRPVSYTAYNAFSKLAPLQKSKDINLRFNFRTKDMSGILLYSNGTGSKFIAMEFVNGYVNLRFNNGKLTRSVVASTPLKTNDNKWHMLQLQEIKKGGYWYFRVMVDDTVQDIRIPGGQKLALNGNLYIGGLPKDMLEGTNIASVLKSSHGFIGSVASVNFNGQLSDLMSGANDKNNVLSSSPDLDGCSPTDPCSNGGMCIPGSSRVTCNCSMTGYIGETCSEYPVGVYFNSNLEDDLLGIIKYRLASANSENDEIAFGFMTFEKDGVLMRIESSNSKEYIAFRLKSGYVIVQYNTGSGVETLRYNSTKFNDGLYHTVQFIRTPTGGVLHVDGNQLISTHKVSHSMFDQVQYVYISGRLDGNYNIIKPFTGIIGGVYYNGYRILDLGKSAIGARWIGDYKLITTGKSGFILNKKQLPTAPPRNPIPPTSGPYIIPTGLGGGGVVIPNTSSGTIAVGNGGSISGGGGLVFGQNGNGVAITGALTGSGGSGIPIFLITKEGPRAGFIVGNVLGILAFLTSLIWAFYGLKPGMCSMKGEKGKRLSFKNVTPTVLTSAAVTGPLNGGSGNGNCNGALSTKVIFVNGAGKCEISGGGVDSGSVLTGIHENSTAAAISGGATYRSENNINMDGGYGMSDLQYSSTAKLLDSDGGSYQTNQRSAIISHQTGSVSTQDDTAINGNYQGTGGGMYGKEYSSTIQCVTNKHRNEAFNSSDNYSSKVVFFKGSDNISCDGVDGGSVFTVFNGRSTTETGGAGYSLQNDRSLNGGYGTSNTKSSSTAQLLESYDNAVSYGTDNRSAFAAYHGNNGSFNTETGGLDINGSQYGTGNGFNCKSSSSTLQTNQQWNESSGYSSSYNTTGKTFSSSNSYCNSIMIGSQSAMGTGESDYDFASGTGTMNIEDIIDGLDTIQSTCQVDNEERYLIENKTQEIVKNGTSGMNNIEKGYSVSCVGTNSGTVMPCIEQSTTQNIINTQTNESQHYNSSYTTSDQISYLSTKHSSSSLEGLPATIPGESTTADYDFASGTGTMFETGYNFDILNESTTMQSSQQIDRFHVSNGQETLKTIYTADGTFSSGLKGGVANVDCCIINDVEHTVIAGSTNCPPKIWNMQTGELIKTMKGAQIGSSNLHLACNGQLLVGTVSEYLDINESFERKGVTAKRLQIWDVLTGNPLNMGTGQICSALCVMSDPDKVVFGRSDKFGNSTSILAWDVVGNQKVKEMIYDAPVGINNDHISSIALSQDDRYCVAGFVSSFDHFAEFVVLDMKLHVSTTKDATTMRLDADPECTAILPHYNVCTGTRTGDIIIWNLRTGHADRRLSVSGANAHGGEVRTLTLSKDSKYLVSTSADSTVRVWDMAIEKIVRNFSQLTDEVLCSTISDDNTIIVCGFRNGTIRLWQRETGKEICASNTGVDIFNIAISKDNEIIVALGDQFRSRKLIMLQIMKPKHHQDIIS